MNNQFTSCTQCNEYLCEVDMFRTNVKTGKYLKKCYNCTGRTNKEFLESMSKIFGKEELDEMLNNRKHT